MLRCVKLESGYAKPNKMYLENIMSARRKYL